MSNRDQDDFHLYFNHALTMRRFAHQYRCGAIAGWSDWYRERCERDWRRCIREAREAAHRSRVNYERIAPFAHGAAK